MSVADLRRRLARLDVRTPRPEHMTSGEMRQRLCDIWRIDPCELGALSRECEAGGLQLTDVLRAAPAEQVAQ